MRILFNHVLIKPDPNNKIILLGGTELYFDTRFEEEKSAPQSGTVIALPEKLKFSTDPSIVGSLDIKTQMELKVGDRVVFNYLSYYHAMKGGLVIDGNILVSYDMIYAAVRNNKVIPICGSVIVEPLPEEVKTKLYVPKMVRGKKLKIKGTVIHASKFPHEQFRRQPEYNTMASPMVCTDNGFEELGRYAMPGDIVLFRHFNAIPLQHYHELNGAISRKLLYRMQHTDIEMVVNPVEEYA